VVALLAFGVHGSAPIVAGALHWLVSPFGSEFMQRAMLELALLAVVGGTLGSWVVLFGLSYGAESLSHAMFPGLVVATLTGGALVVGGLGGVLVAATAIALFASTPGVGRDTSIAIVVTTLFGIGALLALSPSSPPGIESLLFGSILAVSASDLVLAAALTAGIVVALALLHGQLLVVGFDRSHARDFGGRPLLVDAALLGLLGLSVVVAAQGIGTLLAPAVLIGPAATARLLTRRLLPMMAVATACGLGGGLVGLYLSYYAGTAAGASIAGVIVAVYVAVAALAPRLAASAGQRAQPMPATVTISARERAPW
jgi:ABC-type Mn2+/Zn2+ transport system permease subunit